MPDMSNIDRRPLQRRRPRDCRKRRACAYARCATASSRRCCWLPALVAVFITRGHRLHPGERVAAVLRHVSLADFFTDTMWTPMFDQPRYGIMPLVAGTLVTTLVALCLAIPCGTIIAIYLSEFAPHRVREIVKPALELLGAVPTVVYGYFALLMVTPFLQKFIPGLPGFNMLSPGLVIGIMIIPYVASVSEDAMRAVPNYMREGSYAMGATRFQTATRVVVPGALSGIAAAYILGISRAVGETMVVAVAGRAAAEPDLEPAGVGGHDHRLHRAGEPG